MSLASSLPVSPAAGPGGQAFPLPNRLRVAAECLARRAEVCPDTVILARVTGARTPQDVTAALRDAGAQKLLTVRWVRGRLVLADPGGAWSTAEPGAPAAPAPRPRRLPARPCLRCGKPFDPPSRALFMCKPCRQT